MRCAFAFLLIPDSSVLQEGRFLVIGVDTNFSHYSVHEPLIPDKFPEVRPELGIAMTTYHANDPGTYVRAYCSSKVKVQNIIATVISGHDDITDISHINFGVKEKDLEPCLSHIQSTNSGHSYKTAISLKSLVQNKICSTRDVFSLNFRNKLGLMGDYGFFARRSCIGKKWINVDVPLETQQIFLHEHVYGEPRHNYAGYLEVSRSSNLMAWYQGHLHLYTKPFHELDMYKITGIGSEAGNAEQLQLGLLQNFAEAKNFDTLIDNLTKNPARWSLRRLRVSRRPEGLKFEWISAKEQIRRFIFPMLPKFHIEGKLK